MDLSAGVVLLAALAVAAALIGLALHLRGQGDEPRDPADDEPEPPRR
jgi:hypothetical protein